MTDRFPASLAFTWRPDMDGQAYHVTPGDTGGPTAWGVTLDTYTGWRRAHGMPVTTPGDLRAATKPGLSELIRAYYWLPVSADRLPPGIDLLVYDFGFGSGPGTSARIFQQQVGVEADGWIGPQTLAAVAARPAPLLAQALADRHAAFYRSLSTFTLFGRGWLRRNEARLQLALSTMGPGAVALHAGTPIGKPIAQVSAAQSVADHEAPFGDSQRGLSIAGDLQGDAESDLLDQQYNPGVSV